MLVVGQNPNLSRRSLILKGKQVPIQSLKVLAASKFNDQPDVEVWMRAVMEKWGGGGRVPHMHQTKFIIIIPN